MRLLTFWVQRITHQRPRDAILLKSLELDALRRCLKEATAEFQALTERRAGMHSTVTNSIRTPYLPPEIISRILNLVHIEHPIQLRHLGPNGTDVASQWFIETVDVLAPNAASKRYILASAIATVGLGDSADLPQALEVTDPLKLCVLFGESDERLFFDDSPITPSLEALLVHAPRWREVRVESWDFTASCRFLEHCAPALPYIHHLRYIVNSEAIAETEAARLRQIWDGMLSETFSLAGAHITLQYLRTFVDSGAFVQVRLLTLQIGPRRGEQSIEEALGPLARIGCLTTLEIVEDNYKSWGIPRDLSKVRPLRHPSLRRVHLKGFTPTAVQALATYFQECHIEEFAMEDTPFTPDRTSAPVPLFPALVSALPHVKSFSSDHVCSPTHQYFFRILTPVPLT